MSHPVPFFPFLVRRDLAFPGLALPDDMVNSKSVVGMKPGDSSVVIGYKVDEFTHTCLVKHFVAQSFILASWARCHH